MGQATKEMKRRTENEKKPDLILLAGDPLQDIRTLRQPEMVFRDGRLMAQQGRIVLATEDPTTKSR